MAEFRVWVRSLGHASRVRVEGLANARWLVERLGQLFIFKDSRPFVEDETNVFFSFHVPHNSQISRIRIEKALARLPEVKMMLEPA